MVLITYKSMRCRYWFHFQSTLMVHNSCKQSRSQIVERRLFSQQLVAPYIKIEMQYFGVITNGCLSFAVYLQRNVLSQNFRTRPQRPTPSVSYLSIFGGRTSFSCAWASCFRLTIQLECAPIGIMMYPTKSCVCKTRWVVKLRL